MKMYLKKKPIDFFQWISMVNIFFVRNLIEFQIACGGSKIECMAKLNERTTEFNYEDDVDVDISKLTFPGRTLLFHAL